MDDMIFVYAAKSMLWSHICKGKSKLCFVDNLDLSWIQFLLHKTPHLKFFLTENTVYLPELLVVINILKMTNFHSFFLISSFFVPAHEWSKLSRRCVGKPPCISAILSRGMGEAIFVSVCFPVQLSPF